jgi:hypothetical protein
MHGHPGGKHAGRRQEIDLALHLCNFVTGWGPRFGVGSMSRKREVGARTGMVPMALALQTMYFTSRSRLAAFQAILIFGPP